MSNKKKNYKNVSKKKLSPETKDKLKTGFLTTINNDACIKAGREYSCIAPIIIAVCSVLLAVLPSFINNWKTNVGDNVLSAHNGLETSLAAFESAMGEKNVKLQISNDGVLDVAGSNFSALYEGEKQYYCYVNDVSEREELRVFITSDDVNIDTIINNNTSGTETLPETTTNSSGETVPVTLKYGINCLVFGPRHFRFAIYPQRSSTLSSSLTYSYERTKGLNIADLHAKDVTLVSNPSTYIKETREQWKGFLNAAYYDSKVASTFSSFGIMAGIDAGLIILLGLVIFLVTRGKRNPYRIYTFWQTQKMAYWAASVPAILAMILAFIFAQTTLSLFFFVFVYGMRMMWMTMRSLSTAKQA